MRFSTSFFIVLSLGSACSTTTTGTRRGDLLSTTPLDTTVDDRPKVEVSPDFVATMGGTRRTCTNYRHDYQQLADQQYEHPRYSNLVIGGLLSLGGFAAFAVTFTPLLKGEDNESKRNLLQPVGMVAGLGGLVYMLMTSLLTREIDEQVAVLDEPVSENERKCSDAPLQVKKAMAYELRLDGKAVSGRTAEDGTARLVPQLTELVRGNTNARLLERVATGGALPFELKLDGKPAQLPVGARQLSDSTWDAWGGALAKGFSGVLSLRWTACGDLSPLTRVRAECTFAPQKQGPRLAAFDGKLAGVDGASWYAKLDEITVDRAQAFRYHVLLPAAAADWLLRVVDVDTGDVVAEEYSTGADVRSFGGRLPKKGRYALVHTSPKQGWYASLLALPEAP